MDDHMDATEQINRYIESIDDWRGTMLAHLRAVIAEGDSRLSEAWKWDTPVWTRNGKNVCSISAFKDHVKINFFKGAALDDPRGLFNAGLDAKAMRSIDLYEGDQIDAQALKELVHSATEVTK
jgi:hypothetical protein